MTPYEQGFMDKCAELGIDPQVLVKRSAIVINPAFARTVADLLGVTSRVAGAVGRGARFAAGAVGRGARVAADATVHGVGAAADATARGAAHLLPPGLRDSILARLMTREGLPPVPGVVRVPGSGGGQWRLLPEDFGERLASSNAIHQG